ncbi:MAG: hypothetical protein JST76_09505 [Bacteroidetes bacterium]|nr:hypothetical protein [Bacteroidota bacterium]
MIWRTATPALTGKESIDVHDSDTLKHYAILPGIEEQYILQAVYEAGRGWQIFSTGCKTNNRL